MSSRRAPRALDDRELISAILDRLAGGRPFAPGKLAGALEADGLRLELEGTITRAPASDEIAKYRAAVLEELATAPRLATRCGSYLARPRRGSYSKHGGQCEGKTIVAALVVGAAGAAAWPVHRRRSRFLFVCGRHLEAHGLALADILAVVHLTPRELEEPRRRAAEEERAAERRRREEEAEIARRAVAEFPCRTCGAAPGERCHLPSLRGAAVYSPSDAFVTSPHYDRCSDAEDRILEERRAAERARVST